MTNINPLTNPNLSNIRIHKNIFCIGDVNLSRVNEEKGVLPAKTGAEICAHNILEMIHGGNNFRALP